MVAVTEAEGPGRRFALWVQGCQIRCPGCCNPHLFEREGGQDLSVAAVTDRIREVRGSIEGVTFLGGEPFEQAGPLSRLARAAQGLGLSVMTFTGHLLEELRSRNDPEVDALIEATDLLVDGPYVASLPERDRRWTGSTNQRFHFLSARYPPGVERPQPGEPLRTVELRLDGARLQANGWPELRRR